MVPRTPNMEMNTSILETNVTLEQIASALNVNVSLGNLSDPVTAEELFSLYDAYRLKEQELMLTYTTVAYVLGTLIILSNLTVVISSGLILRKGQQQKSTYLLLGNVSLADMIIGISIIFGAIVGNGVNSRILCAFRIGMIVCPTLVSIFSVGLIAIDRYIYIIHGLYYHRWINTTRVRIGILLIWLVGIFIASMPAMGWTGQTFTNFRCWYIAVFPSSLLVVVSIIALFVIIMVCVLYFIILHSAVKAVDQIKAFKETNYKIAYVNKAFHDECKKYDEISETTVTITLSTENCMESCNEIEMHELNKHDLDVDHYRRNKWTKQIRKNIVKMSHYYKKARALNSNPSKLKAAKTVILVTACFVCTWAPYYISIILYVQCDILKNGYACIPLETLTLGPLYYLGVTNSLCDPLIYAWWHPGFKKCVWKYVWKIRIFRIRHGWWR